MRVYQIFVDRFSTGDTHRDAKLAGKTANDWLGGNLKGIVSKLDYIADLGFDAIWLTPIYKGSAYHGYHVTDFYRVDPHFGTNEDFARLVREAHRRDIRVILDFVPNHVSRYHPFFIEAQKNPNSEYRDWFIFKHWPNDYMCFEDVRDLPKLDLYNPDARNYILDSAEFWLNFGIDGFRLDHVVGPPFDLWRDLIRLTHSYSRDIILMPEIWVSGARKEIFETFWFLHHSRRWWKQFYWAVARRGEGDVWVWKPYIRNPLAETVVMRMFLEYFDTPLDFVTNFYIRRSVKLGEVPDVRLPKKHFHFLDNHDMDRIMMVARNDKELILEALRYLVENAENVIFYYGTEIGATHSDPVSSKEYGDLQVRGFMDWSLARDGNPFFRAVKEILASSR